MARLYVFDEAMLGHVDEIAAAIDATEAAARAGEDLAAPIRTLDDALKLANDTFDSRNEILMDVG